MARSTWLGAKKEKKQEEEKSAILEGKGVARLVKNVYHALNTLIAIAIGMKVSTFSIQIK